MINILEDNITGFMLIRDSEDQTQIKDIDTIYHHVRKLLEKKRTIGEMNTKC